MDTRQDTDGSIEVSYDAAPLSRVLGGLAGILVIAAIYDVTIGTRGTDRLVALLASAGTFGLCALAFLERSQFRFDPVRKQIDWTRRWGLRRRCGSVPFHEVARVVVEVPIGDSGVPSRRIGLRLASGSLVPLTIGYRTDGDGKILAIAARLRAVLGHDVDPSPAAQAQDFVADGNVIAAVKLLVEREGVTLADAKRRIDTGRR